MDSEKRTSSPILVEEIGRFLDRVLEVLGEESVRSFAHRAGIAPGTMHNILNGGLPRLDNLIAIANAASVTVEWLATGRGFKHYSGDNDCYSGSISISEDEANSEGSNEFELVNLYDAQVSMGSGAWNDSEHIISRLAFRVDWLMEQGLHAQNCATIVAKGDSMEETIKDGSTLLINLEDTEITRDGIYVIMFDGHLLAKRLQRTFDGGVIIKSDNQAYSEMQVPKERVEELRVVGRVAWFGNTI